MKQQSICILDQSQIARLQFGNNSGTDQDGIAIAQIRAHALSMHSELHAMAALKHGST
jgi:hypothetical protein